MISSTPSLFARLAAGPQRRANRILVHTVAMAALVFLLIASGTGITFALWTSQDEVSVSASRAKLQVSVEANDLDFTFANHKLSSIGSFTVTNRTVTNSEQEASYSVALGFTGDPELAAALGVAVWPASAGCGVEPSDPVASGTWAAFPSQAIAGSLSAGQSETYCVRSVAHTRDSLAAADGSRAIQPSITATMTVGNWSTLYGTTVAMNTEWIYPSRTPAPDSWFRITSIDGETCVDVEAEENAENKPVIAYGCKESGNLDNQHWRFQAVESYNRVISRQVSDDEPGSRAMAVLSGAMDDDARVVITSVDAAHSLWQLQEASDGVYQLVAQQSGRCLVPGPKVGEIVHFVQSACNGLIEQRFALEDADPVVEPTPVLPPVNLNENARYNVLSGGSCVSQQYDVGGRLLKDNECGVRISQWRITAADGGAHLIATAYNEYVAETWYWDAAAVASGVTPTAKSNSTTQRWHLAQRPDGLVQFASEAHGLCLTMPTAQFAFISLEECDDSRTAQGFQLTMIGNPNPSQTPLSCTATDGEIVFDWVVPATYEQEVRYRASRGSASISGVDSYNGTVRIGKSDVVSWGAGPHTVLVEQQIRTGEWTIVGTGLAMVAPADSTVSCGTP